MAAGVTILAVGDDGDDGGDTTGVSALGQPPGDRPAAPWRAAPVPRASVPPDWAAAWDQAGNRTTCALLFPLDGGPEMATSEATGGPTPDGRGWDIFLTSAAGTIEVLGLFNKTPAEEPPAGAETFSKSWSDGSQAVYRPETGNLAPGTYDPDASAVEAVLTLPDQTCAYRIYDTLGRAHLESLFGRLRLLAP